MTRDRPRIEDHADSRYRILRHIRRIGGASQVELAEAVGLTKGTVSQLVGDLLRQGMLMEEASASTGRGRPRVRLTINPGAATALGFFPMRDGRAIIELVDLQGTRVISREVAFRFPEPERLVPLLGDTLEAAIAMAPGAGDRIRAIGIVLPAHLDRDRGVIHWMPPHRLDAPLPVSDPLAARLGLPVSLENRATVLARAEHWFGEPDKADDFTMIALMDAGMGAASYVGGRLEGGVHGMNNEFGHVKIAFEGGAPCYCGGAGCLAAYVTVPGIARAMADLRGRAVVDRADSGDLFRQALVGALSGEGEVLAILTRAGRALGHAIASHVNERDPGRVIVASMYEDVVALLEPVVRATVNQQALPSLVSRTVLDFRTATADGLVQGTAALALERLYRLP